MTNRLELVKETRQLDDIITRELFAMVHDNVLHHVLPRLYQWFEKFGPSKWHSWTQRGTRDGSANDSFAVDKNHVKECLKEYKEVLKEFKKDVRIEKRDPRGLHAQIVRIVELLEQLE